MNRKNRTERKNPKKIRFFFVRPACKSILRLARELRRLTGGKGIRSQGFGRELSRTGVAGNGRV
jgi:hypothetical protein